MIPKETVDKVIATADIVEVVSDFVNLHRAGVNYKGLCPFHNERTPSFTVSPAKQFFKCFGCGESGTSVGFVMKHENLTYPEAIRWLAKKYNITVEERELSAEEIAQMKERESITVLNTFAQKLFTENLTNTEEGKIVGLSYFKKRGFTDETIHKFQLGYSLDARTYLLDKAVEKGHQPEMLEKAGLVIEKQPDALTKIISSKQKYFDRFRARVMFPIHSLSGNVIAFGGRTLKQDKTLAKYLNSPETTVYHKRNSLYGIYFAKNEIVKQNKCFLVEGYTDVISFHQKGVTNTVASSGTSLTEEQIRIIRRFTRNLTLIFDGDNAGIKAAIRGVDLVLQEDMNVRIVVLPPEDDPDTFAQKNSTADLKEYIEKNETDFIIFKINLFSQDIQNDPIKKSAVLKEIVKSISVIPDQIKRDSYIKETSVLMNIKEEILFSEVSKEIKNYSQQINNVSEASSEVSKRTPDIPTFVEETSLPEEEQLVYFLLRFGKNLMNMQAHSKLTVADYIIQEIESEKGFKNIIFQKIFEEYQSLILSNQEIDAKYFMNHQDDLIRETTTRILSKEQPLSKIWERNGNQIEKPDDTYSQDVHKTIIAFKLRLIHIYLENNNKKLQDSNLDDDTIKSIMNQSKEAQKVQQQLMEIGGKRNIYLF